MGIPELASPKDAPCLVLPPRPKDRNPAFVTVRGGSKAPLPPLSSARSAEAIGGSPGHPRSGPPGVVEKVRSLPRTGRSTCPAPCPDSEVCMLEILIRDQSWSNEPKHTGKGTEARDKQLQHPANRTDVISAEWRFRTLFCWWLKDNMDTVLILATCRKAQRIKSSTPQSSVGRITERAPNDGCSSTVVRLLPLAIFLR